MNFDVWVVTLNFTVIIFQFLDKFYNLDTDPYFESGSRRQFEYGSIRIRIHNTDNLCYTEDGCRGF